ncbi:MAG: hypothetical protein CMD39_00535 [Gammaproteobacteria bacterium]|nr:hypothetical protein [Gammaproteobacteria bacterium]
MWLMWKAFTSAALCLTLVGCASTGGAPQPATAGEDPAAAAVDGGPAARPMPPMPEVSGHNADVFARATELFLDGRLVEAEALLLEVTADQPELAGPWVNLAQVYLAQERPDEALGALEQAVLANPGNCAARTELGVLLRKRGDFQGAEAHYLACLEYQPDYQAAYLNLGILYDLYLGRLGDALAAYRQYQHLAAEPDSQVNGWVVDLERRVGS